MSDQVRRNLAHLSGRKRAPGQGWLRIGERTRVEHRSTSWSPPSAAPSSGFDGPQLRGRLHSDPETVAPIRKHLMEHLEQPHLHDITRRVGAIRKRAALHCRQRRRSLRASSQLLPGTLATFVPTPRGFAERTYGIAHALQCLARRLHALYDPDSGP
jgi:hypothetical protein